MHLRPASLADNGFIRDLCTEAFAPFGDYRDLLPRWTSAPGVSSWVAADPDPCGFVMVGFYFGDAARSWVFADVLAIAVAPEHRGMGVGRRLLRHAVEIAKEARACLDVRELRLTVAEDNEGARRLFSSEGYVQCEENHGHYDRGQLALRMRRPLPPGN